MVFQFNFSGVTYTAAIAAGVSGWVPLGCSAIGADDVEINAAVVYVNGLGGGKVIIRIGLYTLTATVNLLASTGLSGSGENSHITSAGNFHLITISAQDDCFVEYIQLSGTSTGNNADCINIEDGSDRFHIHHNIISDSDRDGILIEGTDVYEGWITENHITNTDRTGINVFMDMANYFYHSHILNNHFEGCGAGGIAGFRYADGIISDNTVYNCTGTGIYVEASLVMKINDNLSYGNSVHGLYVWESNRIQINDNFFVSNTENGIRAGADGECHDLQIEGNFCYLNGDMGLEVLAAEDWQVEGNYLVDSGEHGISIQSSSPGSVNGNYVVGNGTTVGDWHGIRVFTSWYIKITDNYCNDNDLDGIFLVGDTDETFIHGNYLLENGRYGVNISVATCNDNEATDNYYSGNGAGCINDQGTDTKLATVPIQLIQGTIFISTAGEAWGWEISADTNFALGVDWLPLLVQQVVRIRVIGVALAAPGAGDYMRIQITGEGGTFGEDFATEPIDVVDHNNEEVSVAIDGVVNWVFDATDDADIGHLLGGDRIQIKVLHEGAGNGDAATNAIVDSIQIEYV